MHSVQDVMNTFCAVRFSVTCLNHEFICASDNQEGNHVASTHFQVCNDGVRGFQKT